MEDVTVTITDFITQEDPFVTDERLHLDFEFLRSEGLKHIGELSGKIWTDHNAHDPGVTILEVLCFALLDLGYRTTLSIPDLLALEKRESKFAPDNNFLTPFQALTCNPTTLLDYRKLLLEVDGVKNAWIEPVDDIEFLKNSREVPMFWIPQSGKPDGSDSSLLCEDPGTDSFTIVLNGLYRVLLEMDAQEDGEIVEAQVRSILANHRNLCQDTIVGKEAVQILKPISVGIHADIEIETGIDIQDVYEAILRIINAYISPEITHYTLQQMLKKGNLIEDIYAGRAYHIESHGFIDSEELENLPRRKTLYSSDLYNDILTIEVHGKRAIKMIRSLRFNPQSNSVDSPDATSEALSFFKVTNDCVPSFSLEKTQIKLLRGGRILEFNTGIVERRLIKRDRSPLDRRYLDLPIPSGTYREDLSDYYSIQNEFPVVYGIGEGHLPDTVPLQRKVQAAQLKAYLLFYDQLLADFLAQLAHIRDLFSLQQESLRDSTSRHTYFTQKLDTIPDIATLLQTHEARDITFGSLIAIPVANEEALQIKLRLIADDPRETLVVENSCDASPGSIKHFSSKSASLCEVHLQQAIRDISQEDFLIEIHKERRGYLFIVCFTQVQDIVLISFSRYASETEAREAANFATFLATIPENYQKSSLKVDAPTDIDYDEIEYRYDLVYKPEAYATYLQSLLEDETTYISRRNAFLDHLLARFAHQFTDYALVRFGANELRVEERKQSVEDKSRFLDHYDDTGRNRGKAFNYLEPSWLTSNVSGFEKRVSLLSGMTDWKRRSLCKFEVNKCYSISIKNFESDDSLSSLMCYDSEKDYIEARKNLIDLLRDPEQYSVIKRRFLGFKPDQARRLFANPLRARNIEPATHKFGLRLKNYKQEEEHKGSTQNNSKSDQAWEKRLAFIEEVNTKIRPDGSALALQEIPEKRYLFRDETYLAYHPKSSVTYRWHLHDNRSNTTQSAESSFPNEQAALEHFCSTHTLEGFVIHNAKASHWQITPHSDIPLISKQRYASDLDSEIAWRIDLIHGQSESNYKVEKKRGGGWKILLSKETGELLAQATIPKNLKLSPEEYVQACISAFSNETTFTEHTHSNKAFQFYLLGQDSEILLYSILCYDTALEATQDFLKAYDVAHLKKSYIKDASDLFEGSRLVLCINKNERIAVSPTPYFKTAKERNAKLAAIQKEIKAQKAPLQIKADPTTYSWELLNQADQSVLLQSSSQFESAKKADADFAATLDTHVNKNLEDFLSRHIYRIEEFNEPDTFRYIYFSPEEQSVPLLKSVEDFPKKIAQDKYIDFQKNLASFQVKKDSKSGEFYVAHGRKRIASIIDPGNNDTAQKSQGQQNENVEKTKALLNYMRQYFPEEIKGEDPGCQFVYRLIDKNNPLAKVIVETHSPTPSELTACYFDPYIIDLKQPVLRVICPAKDPQKYHFALCLLDEDSDTYRIVLVSYQGYTSREEALKLGQKQWILLIEKASNLENYGPNQLISETEQYSDSTPVCTETQPYLAVIPESAPDDLGDHDDSFSPLSPQQVSEMAMRFPIRIRYKLDKEGKVTDEIEGYTFRGYSNDHKTWRWESVKAYMTPSDAIEAYQHFTVMLSNGNSCRTMCVENIDVIYMMEILAQSTIPYTSRRQAWGELSSPEEDEPDEDKQDNTLNNRDCKEIDSDNCKHSCDQEGVRQFIRALDSNQALIQKEITSPSPTVNGDSITRYSFDIVSPDYCVARHTCFYPDSTLRDKEKGRFQDLYEKELNECEGNDQAECPEILDKPICIAQIEGEDGKKVLVLQFWLTKDSYLQSRPLSDSDDIPGEDEREQIIDKMLFLALKKKNFEERSNQIYLIDPFVLESSIERTVAAIFTGDSSKPVQERINNIVKLVRSYPIYRKNGKFRFRHQFGSADSVFEKDLADCKCKEKTDEEPFDPCAQIYIYESKYSFDCREDAIKAYRHFWHLLGDEANYHLTKESEIGPYSFEIIDPSQKLASHPYAYEKKVDSIRATKRLQACIEDEGIHVLEHILLRLRKNVVFEGTPREKYVLPDTCDTLPICPDPSCILDWELDPDLSDPCYDPDEDSSNFIQYVPGTDPYSYWATVVLPSWTMRFQTEERRLFFKEMLYQEVPALVGLNIAWLSPMHMCKFEEKYKLWLEWLRDPNHTCGDSERILRDMIECIAHLQNDEPCGVADPDGNQYDPDSCIQEVDNLFWSQETDTDEDDERCPDDSPSTITSAKEAKPQEKVAPPRKDAASQNVKRANKAKRNKESKSTKQDSSPVSSPKGDPVAIRSKLDQRRSGYQSTIASISDENVKKNARFWQS